MDDLITLATLIGQRNAIDREIGSILGRPFHIGHLFEFVISRIFDIALNESARQEASDWVFRTRLLAERTVNVKYTARHQGILNLGTSLEPDHHPECYLVLAGPRTTPGSSISQQAPLCIDSVYPFDTPSLLNALFTRGLQPRIARSMPRVLWDAAMIFPGSRNPLLPLIPEQRSALALLTCH